MKIIVNAGIDGFIRLREEPIIIPDKVIIEAKPSFKTEHLILTVQSPNAVKDFNADEECDVSEMCKMEGEVKMKLAQYSGGRKVCEWQIEPLILRRADDSIHPIPAIAHLSERLAETENTVLTLKEAIKELYKLYKE